MVTTISKCIAHQGGTIYEIVENCKAALQSGGIFQWTDHYPTLQIIQNDIESGHLYQIQSGKDILGIINISAIQEEEYKNINWSYPVDTSLVIHRLAIDPKHQGQGFAQKLMTFAENYGKQRGFHSIRLDAYSQNTRVLRFYDKRAYAKRGEIYFPGRDLPFYCYEKQLVKNENRNCTIKTPKRKYFSKY
ncbi:MAG TPA: GNAT family N-acetyltransferase [Edaphocola sp.]|nr:GNAT family N-acetyltransferase [Edaphocola sp.]